MTRASLLSLTAHCYRLQFLSQITFCIFESQPSTVKGRRLRAWVTLKKNSWRQLPVSLSVFSPRFRWCSLPTLKATRLWQLKFYLGRHHLLRYVNSLRNWTLRNLLFPSHISRTVILGPHMLAWREECQCWPYKTMALAGNARE